MLSGAAASSGLSDILFSAVALVLAGKLHSLDDATNKRLAATRVSIKYTCLHEACWRCGYFNMAASDNSGNEQLKELEDRLEEFIEMLRSVGVIAGDFQPNGQTVLNERM